MLRTRDAEILDEIRSDFEKRVAVEGPKGRVRFSISMAGATSISPNMPAATTLSSWATAPAAMEREHFRWRAPTWLALRKRASAHYRTEGLQRGRRIKRTCRHRLGWQARGPRGALGDAMQILRNEVRGDRPDGGRERR